MVSRAATRAARCLFAVFALAFISLPIAFAQSPGLPSSSYITPFPQTERYQLRVIGDWLGQGLFNGLEEAFKQDASVQIVNASRANFSLARAEQNDLFGEIDRMIASGPVHIAVIMLGVNDRQAIRIGNGWVRPGTPEWKDFYGKEAEKLIKKLKAANIAVYWVGLPVMANSGLNEAVAAMNDAVRQAAYLNGAKFIETWAGFTDQLGGYTAYGPDLMGQTRRLREGDGVGLTAAGNRKLANYVEVILRRDLAQARAQRNIPLAGDEEEQARVVPQQAPPAKAGSGKKTAAELSPDATPLPSTAESATKDQAGRVSAAQAPQGAVQPQPSRRDQAAFSTAFQQGELILGDLGNGLTAISVISPVNEFSIRDIQRQTPLGDRLYFRALSKGEALQPKPGRADDFRWGTSPASQTQ